MAIDNDKSFEDNLARLCRFYRAMRLLWKSTNAKDQDALARWVIDAGKILETLSETLGDIEDYAGCMELRIIVDQMKTIRAERDGRPEKV